MNIIITGGCGFIASHITDRLLQDGHHVTVLDLWQSQAVAAHTKNPRMKFVAGNVLDDRITTELLRGRDVLIHAAAILGTSETITDIDVEETVLTNVLGSVKILKNAKAAGISKVIVPTTPDVPWLNPYKITKAAVEKFCHLFAGEFDLEVIAFQLGNVYGARERWLNNTFGAPFSYQKIIPTILMQTLKGESFSIYGDGAQESEYIYVDDVVEVVVQAIECDKNLGGKTIPIGVGQGFSVNQIIATIEKVWGKKIKRKYTPMRPGEAHTKIRLDPKPLMRHLGYEIRYSLEHGLEKTIDWYERMHREETLRPTTVFRK